MGADLSQHACISNFGRAAEEGDGETTQILILGFNKHYKEFTDSICESPLAQSLLQKGVDVTPEWANGAKILVEGLTAALLQEARFPAKDLKRSHVVVLPEHESDVHDALKELRSRIRPGVKTRKLIMCQVAGNDVAEEEEAEHDDDEEEPNHTDEHAKVDAEWNRIVLPVDLEFSKTFLSVATNKFRPGLSPRSAYAKSSNDRYGIENPRKWKASEFC